MSVSYDDFRGRHVVVTGAGAGIGRATAVAFAGQGARVTAIDRDAGALDETAGMAVGITVALCDLADHDALRETIGGALDRDGKVRCLVNNAGSDRRIAFGDMTAENWRWTLAVNLDHHMLTAALVAPRMDLADGHAAIVNMSSSAFMKLAGNLTAYHAAKAGIVGFTRGLARDLGQRGITVNAIAPGRVVTERVAAKVTADWEAETRRIQCVPDLISPADIADAVLWLGSSASRFVTGQTLVVDGGVV
ncbi:SDR family NAD(P)-dependent oxidoreductase [Bauldia sp.]|uniref:SDR family NAD(P)-dependent oxidoreductase n=1 Tax=Bauldia sp. TaxID=2575872 RepID=UPI003BA8D4C6